MLSRQTWLIFLLCAGVLVMIAAAGGSGQTRAPGSPGSPDDRSVAESPVARRAESGSADSAADGNANALRFSVTTTSIGNERAIVVVDSETQRLLIYSMDNSSRPPLLKLVAVRNLSYDVKLEHWNNAHPYPEEIRSSVTDEGRGE